MNELVVMFHDREEAGRLLAAKLEAYRDDPSGLILALPRGGVAVGYELSVSLRLPLDVFVTRKLSTPDNPEYAIGALSETGALYLNPEAVQAFRLSHADLEAMVDNEQQEISRRQRLYRNGLPLAEIRDRTVILVDDGMATGATFFATLEAVRNCLLVDWWPPFPSRPRKVSHLRNRVDELIVMATPEPFIAVGHHYHNFPQMDDAEVLDYLKAARQSEGA